MLPEVAELADAHIQSPPASQPVEARLPHEILVGGPHRAPFTQADGPPSHT